MADLKINKKFAEKYEKYRQKEELQRLKDRYGDQDQDEDNSSGSSDSDTDESEVELDPKLDRDFYRTLSLLKKKDPKIYQKDAKFYSEKTSESGDEEKPSTSKKSEKPMFLKDYERKVILERGGKYDDDDGSDAELSQEVQERAASPTYIQEQKDLKESFQKFLQDSDEEGSDEEKELLTRRNKTQEEKDKEEADHLEWLKGQAELEEKDEIVDMKYLRDYWSNPQLDEKESFLRDYVLNKGYLEEDDVERIPTYDELVQEDVDDSEGEGESFLQKQEDFERHYNFRFEEPDAEKVKTYPRNIATSVRSKDDRRKKKREELKQRKKKEKEQKQQQLKELKNLKRVEIMDKLKKLQDLTGNEQLAFNEVDLEGDFDPQKHDQLMQKFFGNEYYDENEDEKPEFEDDNDEGHWNWDRWMGENEEEFGEEEGYNAEEHYETNCEDPNFIMDADYDPNQEPVSKRKRRKEREEQKKKSKDDIPLMGKKRRKSHFAEIITKNKPVFDPEEKTFEQYLDEYYKLDYEDIIDDLPCRFRYREVVPNDFGLTTDEILNAEERELNSWCSLKKTCMYRSEKEELCDVKNFQIKAKNNRKKERVLKSLYHRNEGEEMTEAKVKVGKKRRDRIKRAEEKEKQLTEEESESTPADAVDQTEAIKDVTAVDDKEEDEQFLVPKKKKMKVEMSPTAQTEDMPSQKTEKPKWFKKTNRRPGGHLLSGSLMVKMGSRQFSGQRIRAYGLNPKRLHFREMYRQKRKEREKKEKQEKKSKQ